MGGNSVAHIEMALRDENGTLVTDSDEEIEIHSDDNVIIIGVDNGSTHGVGSHKDSKIITSKGRALVILRQKEYKGGATVTLTTKSGLSASYTL